VEPAEIDDPRGAGHGPEVRGPRLSGKSWPRRPFGLFVPAAVVLLVAGTVLFWKLGAASFRDGDEAKYAQCAREMITSGDYLTPHFLGEPFLEKPPLKMWLIVAGYRIFGLSELGARASSALFALATVALTMLLGWLLFGPATGLVGGLVLMSSAQFIHEHAGRAAEMEPEAAFFFVASMLCVWLARRDGRWLCALAASLGLLVMTKGALAAPVLVVAALFAVVGRPRPRVTLPVALSSALVLLAIALPWHIYQATVHGDVFWKTYLGTHVWGRFLGRAPEGFGDSLVGMKPRPALIYYGRVVFSSMFPWSVLVGPALIGGLWEALKRRSAAAQLLLLWAAVFGLTIGISRGKLPWYAVPLLPAFAILVARFARGLADLRPRWLFFAVVVGALALSVAYLPSPQYHPYARHSVAWPDEDSNIAPTVAALRDHTATWRSLVPGLVTVGLVAGAAVSLVFRAGSSSGRRRPRAAVVAALLASLGFSGLCQVALPLKHAENKREIVLCLDAVRAAGIRPERVALVGQQARALWSRAVDKVHIYNFDGGKNPISGNLTNTPQDSAFLSSGTLILADAELHKRLSALGLGPPLWGGPQLEAFYRP
jgi:4-amino-4-deoxy-L-arabinose transferase-like glycosyltransferase